MPRPPRHYNPLPMFGLRPDPRAYRTLVSRLAWRPLPPDAAIVWHFQDLWYRGNLKRHGIVSSHYFATKAARERAVAEYEKVGTVGGEDFYYVPSLDTESGLRLL